MPSRCVVPHCHGNYDNGPTVSAYSYPKDEELASIWTRAINRENFTPNKFSKVCEAHFRPEEIRREVSAFDNKTGRTITVKLVRTFLHKGVIPSILPDPPPLSSTRRVSKKSKRKDSAVDESAPPSLLPNSSSSPTKCKTRVSKKNKRKDSAVESASAPPSLLPNSSSSPTKCKTRVSKKNKRKDSAVESASAPPSLLPNSSSSPTKCKTRVSKKIKSENSTLESVFPKIQLRSSTSTSSSSSSTKRKTRVCKKIKSKNSTRKSASSRILPNSPSSSSSRKQKTRKCKKNKLDNSHLGTASAHDFEYLRENAFHSVDDLEDHLDFLERNYWTVVRQQGTLIICRIVKSPCPRIGFSLVVEPDFAVRVFCGDVEMNSIGEYEIPSHVTDVNTLKVLLENVKELDVEEQQRKPRNVISLLKLIASFLLLVVQDESIKYFNTIKFICEQINLMTQIKLNYSSEMMIFSSLLYTCYPRGYRLLRGTKTVILPKCSSIKRLTLSTYRSPLVKRYDNNFLVYIKSKFKFLLKEDLSVSLLIDEINLKPYSDCTDNNADSLADNENEAATTAFVFTIKSVFSQFKETVHIMPTRCLKAEDLFNVVKRLIIGLEQIGFGVLAVVSENNPRNKRAMSFFCSPEKLSIVYPHPVTQTRPLFFLFDSLDVLKCIRNNWLAQKDKNKCMMFPKFCYDGNHELGNIQSAPFSTLQKLHALYSPLLLEHDHKLTSKVVSRANLGRQLVTLVLQIFNEHTVQELQSLGKQKCLPNFVEVAGYINTFYIWWTILNVKTAGTNDCPRRRQNKYRNPLKLNDESYKFLSAFCSWLERWDRIAGNNGKLTDETFIAVHHTTYAILELTKYCKKELKMAYVLPGKFQTDHLEEKFVRCRQLSDDQDNNISIHEVLECEKKLETLSSFKLHLPLPLSGQSSDLRNLPEINWDEMSEEGEEKLYIYKFNIDVTDTDVDECKEVLPLLIYLTGHCCREVFNKTKCNSCRTLISGCDDAQLETNRFFRGLDSGSLLYPSEMSKNIVLYNYVVTDKLGRNSSFLHCLNRRKLTMHVTLDVLQDADLLFEVDVCDEGHSVEELEKMLIWCSSNALLNNFCNKRNGDLTSEMESKKRRIEIID